ncbi:glycosyltransferase family protein [Halolamina salina]|uniref:Glycosyltransferase n=1 Tax=Halolamina salina TaxID=1220023 RepID=A0ABD6B5P4_9EURY
MSFPKRFAQRILNLIPSRSNQVAGENYWQYAAADTSITIHGGGLGDLMIIRQFGRAIQDFFRDQGDPEQGDIVISTGATPPAYEPLQGDLNLLWWWSFGEFDGSPEQFLDDYLERVSVRPDIILCPSSKTEKEAQQAGFETIYFPLGTYAFEPLGFDRSGIGYAGTIGHKRSGKEEMMLGLYRGSSKFEAVSHFRFPEELNCWYNVKKVTIGMHKEGQKSWGMVNNRVFETLASGTPIILKEHNNLSNVLGFEYPYQITSQDELREMVQRFRQRSDQSIQSEFNDYSQKVMEEHSYRRRVNHLFREIS